MENQELIKQVTEKAEKWLTPAYDAETQAEVANLLQSYPEARVVGHRDLSPDKNYNGIVDPWERTKECPCFEVKAEAWE